MCCSNIGIGYECGLVCEHHAVLSTVIWFASSDYRKSATNCAQTYMLVLPCKNNLPSHWKYKASLDSEHVSDAVITLSLLEDHLSCNATLIIPHEGDQSDWLTAAIEQRNNHIRVAGQPKISHYCLNCMCIYTNLLTGRSKHLSSSSHTQPKECPTSTQKDSK